MKAKTLDGLKKSHQKRSKMADLHKGIASACVSLFPVDSRPIFKMCNQCVCEWCLIVNDHS